MEKGMRYLANVAGVLLALVNNLAAQQPGDSPDRMTLNGLKRFAVNAKVQVSERATLQRIDEELLRSKMELAMRREGLSIVRDDDVRDGSAAQISLSYLVIEIGNHEGRPIGFAASSCLHAAQTVSIPRLSGARRPAYAVVPTWHSCSVLAGINDSYRDKILQNADEQIARFLNAWLTVNRPSPASPKFTPEPGVSESAAGGTRKLSAHSGRSEGQGTAEHE
jgi:hypothetical protein